MKWSVVIPAHNEEKRIGEVLSKIKEELKDCEIIVVDDGSSDRTYDIARGHYVRVIKHKKNMGKGAAVKTGFKNASGDLVGFIDADKSTNINDLKNIFESLNRCDIAIASRYVENSRIIVKQPLLRQLMSKLFNVFIRIVFGLHIKDTQCGCKTMKTSVAKEIAREMKSNGFEFDVELLWIAKKKGYKIEEIPITWKHERGSRFSFKHMPKMFVSLIKTRFIN